MEWSTVSKAADDSRRMSEDTWPWRLNSYFKVTWSYEWHFKVKRPDHVSGLHAIDFLDPTNHGNKNDHVSSMYRARAKTGHVKGHVTLTYTSHLSFQICTGFRFATELVSKLPRLLSECSNLSSHPIFHLSSQDMCRREHSALLRLSWYAFLHVKPPWQLPNYFHLLLQIFGMHLPNHLSSIPTLPVFRRALKHHIFLLAYPDSSAKSGKIKPTQFITLRNTAPTIATAPPGNTCRPSKTKSVPSERLRLVEVINFA